MLKSPRIFEKLRYWLDNDDDYDFDIIQNGNEVRKSEEFLRKIAMSLDSVLQDEIFVPPNKEAQVPNKFVVYINPIDDTLWQNSKRAALEQTLSQLIYDRAVEIADSSTLSAKKMSVSIKCDNNLAHPMFQVVAFWDDFSESHLSETENTVYVPDHTGNSLFRAQVWKNESYLNEISFAKSCAVIGRGSSQIKTDITLPDASVSRLQAKIVYLGNGNFYVTNEGINSVRIGEQIIRQQQSGCFNSADNLLISNFKLKFSVADSALATNREISETDYSTKEN